MSEIVLKVENMTKDYGENRGIFNINLQVKKGEVFGFIGTNGSGKTTTIRNLMGFIQPDKGSSSIYGLDSWKNSAEIMENVSYVPGEIAFPPLATGTKFLKSQAEYLRVKDFSYMNHIIELLQLDPTAKLKSMSKGMKQKTAIVTALMGEKDILVLDEPTTGLDPLMRDAFLNLIREERDKGHTIFMSSHIFEEIEAVCDEVAMIRDGSIIETISLYDLRHPKIKEFMVEFINDEELKEYTSHTKFNGLKIENEICHISVPIEKLNHFFRELKLYKVTNLREAHLSLQKEFINAYNGGSSNGNK